MRKCTNSDVPVIASSRSEWVIRTYENKILFQLCMKLGRFLNRQYEEWRLAQGWQQRMDFIPWIRVFASPVTLLYVILVIFFLGFLLV
jgi:hypothetical protein